MALEHELRDLLRRSAPFALSEIEAELARLERRVEVASMARRRLPPGSSRARVTTANARWARACEARDRLVSLRAELKAALRGGDSDA